MATTNIKLDIENITGIGSGNSDDQFIVSAQKFVVASIPKNLLKFAQTVSSASTDGSAISYTRNDSIIDVQRNGYSCTEIPFSESVWSTTTGSLKKATSSFPVYWHQNDGVKIAPATDGSNGGYIFYVSSSKIDDDSDLRNSVIFHASSSEFSKLGSSSVVDWSTVSVPVAPTLSSDSVSFSTTAPAYTPPVLEARTAFTSYSSGLSETDPGTLTISATAPVPPAGPSFSTPGITSVTVSSTTVSNVGTPPTYTSPVVASDSAGIELTELTSLDADNTIDDYDGNIIEFDQWFSTAAHLIEDEEDTELASSQLQKISTYINAYSQAMQNQLNIFNDANAEYQGKLQESIQQAQINAQTAQSQAQIDSTELQQEASLLLQQENQEYAASLQKLGAEVQKYQADVSKEVQQYQQKLSQYQLELSTSVGAWQQEETQKINRHQTEVHNNLNIFNKENAEYQAQLQISIQDAQLSSQDDAQKLQKYSSELSDYQNQVNELAQKVASGNQKAAYYQAESKKYYEWSVSEINMYISNNSKMINQTIAAQAAQQRR